MNIFSLTALGRAASAGVVVACMTTPPAIAQDADRPGMSHVGKIHDKLRAAKKREAVSFTQGFDEDNRRFTEAKRQIESATGITFAFDASFMS